MARLKTFELLTHRFAIRGRAPGFANSCVGSSGGGEAWRIMIERDLKCLGPSGFHRITYTEWPAAKNAPTLLCVHGLTRNARDFDALAEALSDRYRVVCPDMPGRGRSEYLSSSAEYSLPVYLADLATLIARLDVASLDWLGTSMGGFIGMMMAIQPGNPVRRLVLNDVGPFTPKAAVERISSYVGLDPSFPSLDIMEQALRGIYSTLGPMTDAQMRRMTEISARRRPDGTYGFAYDPRIAEPIKAVPPADLDLWRVWDEVKCPVLLLRGAQSDIVTRETALEMTKRGPKAKLVEFEGVGHAPPLLAEDQIGAVREFLLA
jgi:pimeloyl-ACP methyl ester carboxylesterase